MASATEKVRLEDHKRSLLSLNCIYEILALLKAMIMFTNQHRYSSCVLQKKNKGNRRRGAEHLLSYFSRNIRSNNAVSIKNISIKTCSLLVSQEKE